MIIFNKNAISPVVATALLLVVAVVAVISFQTWFYGYFSSLSATVEEQSVSVEGIQIETIIGNKIYLSNPFSVSQPLVDVSIDSINCYLDKNNVSSGIDEFNIEGCNSVIESGSKEVIVRTENSIIAKTLYLDNDINVATIIPNGTEIPMDSCPNGWTDVGQALGTLGEVIDCSDSSADCRICRSTGTYIPSNSYVFAINVTEDWNLVSFIGLTVFRCPYPDASLTCSLYQRNTGFINSGNRVAMGSCPSGWTDVGYLRGSPLGGTIFDCSTNSSDCRLCEKD